MHSLQKKKHIRMGIGIGIQESKSIQQRNNPDPDNLSELPECLIIKIVSLLEMKDAVRTSVLSKRWEKLWTHVDSIIYHCDIENPTLVQLQRFMSFVNDTLMQCTCAKIKTFSLTGFSMFSELNNERVFKKINEWIEFVLDRDAQFVKLGLRRLDYNGIFYQDYMLRGLEIDEMGSYDSFSLYDVNWTLLRYMSFKSVSLEGKFITELLLSCPMLETMVLDNTWGFSRLNITSQNLKKLKLCNFEYDNREIDEKDEDSDDDAYRGNYLIEINAPWIEELEISGLFIGVQCQLVDVSSLCTANITFNYSNHSTWEDDPDDMWPCMVKNVLKPVSHVNELAIGSELVQALSLSNVSNGPCPVFKCRHLTVCSPIMKYELPGVSYLLKNTASLERLVLKLFPSKCYFTKYFKKYYKKAFSFNGADFKFLQQSENILHLKNVEIEYSRNFRRGKGKDDHKESFSLALASQIVENSLHLEKVVILSSESASYKLAKTYERLLSKHKKTEKWELKRKLSRLEFSFCNPPVNS